MTRIKRIKNPVIRVISEIRGSSLPSPAFVSFVVSLFLNAHVR